MFLVFKLQLITTQSLKFYELSINTVAKAIFLLDVDNQMKAKNKWPL